MADQLTPAELRAAARSALAEVHGQDPRRTYSVAEVKRIVYSIVDANELLADVMEYADSVDLAAQVANSQWAAGTGTGRGPDGRAVALHTLRLARGETNERKKP